jgi:hypothetical protein
MSDDPVSEELVAMTDNYAVWVTQGPDDETVYHLDLDTVTVHLYREEWDEVVELLRQAGEKTRKRK